MFVFSNALFTNLLYSHIRIRSHTQVSVCEECLLQWFVTFIFPRHKLQHFAGVFLVPYNGGCCCIDCCNYYYYFVILDSCNECAKEARVLVCASKASQPIDVAATKWVAAAVAACASFVTKSAAMWVCHVQDILQRNGWGRTLLQSLCTVLQEAMRWHKWWIGRRRSSKLLIRSGKAKRRIEHTQVLVCACACLLACVSKGGNLEKCWQQTEAHLFCNIVAAMRWRWSCTPWQLQHH